MDKILEELINPKEWLPIRLHEVEAHRHFECSEYEACLLLAGRKGWQGFTCKDCFIRILT